MFDILDLFQQKQINELKDDLRSQKAELRSEARDEAFKFISRLEKKIDLLSLINRGIWEILEEKLNVSRDELTQKVSEIDLRDGISDDKLTLQAEDCPKCDAKINVNFNRCFFCGYEPEEQDVFDKISS